MTRSIVTRLVLKDLHFNRWLIGLGIVGGLLAMLSMSRSPMIGMISFVTIVVVCYIFIGLVSVSRERTEKSSLFVLSLPVSTMQYTAAKIVAASISFLIVWSVLLAVGLLLGQLDPGPTANVPTYVALMSLLLTNFYVLLAVGVVTTSEIWITLGIILTNVSVPVFMRMGADAARNAGEAGAPFAAWTPALSAALAVEAAIIGLCLGLIFYIQAKRKDFV